MPETTPKAGQHGPDLLAVVLLGLLAVAALGAIYAVVAGGYMTAGAAVGVIAVGGAFAVVHGMGGQAASPKNTHVHGEARPASEEEARRAARGEPEAARLDDREF
jgi:hypothetical protein